jgi:hypothetical protein
MACRERRVRDAVSVASAPLSRTTFRTIPILPPLIGAIAAHPTAGRNPEQFIFVHYEFSKITTKSRRANFAVSSFSETEHCAGDMQVPRFWFSPLSPVFTYGYRDVVIGSGASRSVVRELLMRHRRAICFSLISRNDR